MKKVIFTMLLAVTPFVSNNALSEVMEEVRFFDGLKLIAGMKDCVTSEINSQVSAEIGDILLYNGLWYSGEDTGGTVDTTIAEVEMLTNRPDPNTGFAGTKYRLKFYAANGEEWEISHASNGSMASANAMDSVAQAYFDSDGTHAFTVDILACAEMF